MSQWILLADDDEMVLNVSKAILEHLGYEVLVARSGQETLEIFSKHRDIIHLIVLDYSMPDRDGCECLREIRKSSGTPALIMTGYGEDFAKHQRSNNLYQGVLFKPFDIDQFREAILAILPKKRASA